MSAPAVLIPVDAKLLLYKQGSQRAAYLQSGRRGFQSDCATGSTDCRRLSRMSLAHTPLAGLL
jgi:hypothetical protein